MAKYIIGLVLLFISITGLLSQQNRYIQCPRNIGCSCQASTISCARVNLRQIPNVPADTKIFDLRFNLIEKIPPRSLKHLITLKSLYLNDNKLKTLEDYAFEGLDNLNDLYLYGNQIESISPKAFFGLLKLQNLFLHTNKLVNIDVGTFAGLPLLGNLYLYNNHITRFPEGVLDQDANIYVLRLDKNNLVCDCDLFWLWMLFENYKANTLQYVGNQLVATCSSPTRNANRQLTSLAKTDFNCKAPVIIKTPKNVEIRSAPNNPDVSFECGFSENPLIKVSWMKNNVEITPSTKYNIYKNGTLLIKNPNADDVATYECVIKNKIGSTKASAQLKMVKSKNLDITNEIEEYEYEYDFDIIPPSVEDNLLKFTHLPLDQAVVEGSNVVFSCRTDNRNNRISWMKDGVPLRDIARMFKQSNGDLQINNVRVEDEGFYVCVLTDNRHEKYAQAELTVNTEPLFLKVPQDASAAGGNSVSFHCSVSGKPKPTIIWRKDGRAIKKSEEIINPHYEILQGNQTLRINNITNQFDAGVYACIAENIVKKITARARLVISRPIKPFFTRVQQNASIYENHALQMGCFASGDPKPQVIWYKDGQRLMTDSRVSFDTFGYLSITEVKVEDGGEYICRATNVAGTTIHKFHISVKDLHDAIISESVITDAILRARGDVNKQIIETRRILSDRRKPKTSAELLHLLRFPKDRTAKLVISEEVYERALEIIFRHANNITYNTTNDVFKLEELLTRRQLQRIADLSGCHQHKRKVNCSQRCLRYRTSDGTCNNLNNPHWGAANIPLRRLLPAEYENGFSTPRGWTANKTHNGFKLPSARVVSSKIISTTKTTNDSVWTHMVMQWGQFLDHDLDHTVMAASLNRFSNGIACKDSCVNDQPCFAIEIPQNDTHRTHTPGKCMEFVRSSAVCGTGETSFMTNQVIQREQINQLTAYIDASNVYGSSDQDAFDIREIVVNKGLLKTHPSTKHPKGLLPFNQDTPMDCQRDNTTQVGCFLAGDFRANEQLALLAIHNLWIRQHNRLAEKLIELNPNWPPEQIYQETRKIVGAQMQHITYTQWLPIIFGEVGMKKLGEYKGYNPNVDVSITNEFATAAFRFGHALIQPFSFRLNETYQEVPEGHLLLRDSFFSPHRYFYEGGMDPLLRGLYGMPAKIKMPREIMNSELTERLFHITRIVSQDLAALNIQRGRDHGIKTYTEYRKLCNMSDVSSFDDLSKEISSREVRNILKDLYGDVRNIDIWPAGILEDVIPGTKLGPLFMCMISRQFKVLREGDRFWYEKPGEFTPEQLREIKKTTLSKIICENGDNIEYIQKDIFRIAKYPQGMLRCSQIEDVSLEPWRGCCEPKSDEQDGYCSEPSLFFTSTENNRKLKR